MGRSGVERVLAGLVGAALGGILSVAIVFIVSVPLWLLVVPPVLCGFTGFVAGDRGIFRIARVFELLG